MAVAEDYESSIQQGEESKPARELNGEVLSSRPSTDLYFVICEVLQAQWLLPSSFPTHINVSVEL